ncbi:Avirulence protein [Phytophthora megakarya]|uniref:RxLR effector protein n=1 Tax=Phytophthora megakarya TaxID=4795 RepID=A0A225VIM7_9STRA|nr:Avirulence protein [Phytophthora megakarya]
MRLTSMFSAAVVGMYFAACNADFDQTNVLIDGSPVLSNEAIDRRLLRAHREDEATAEERTPNLSVIGITKADEALELVEKLMGSDKLAKAAYVWWQHHQYPLTDIKKFFDLASQKSGKNYDQLYNGFMVHADYV